MGLESDRGFICGTLLVVDFTPDSLSWLSGTRARQLSSWAREFLVVSQFQVCGLGRLKNEDEYCVSGIYRLVRVPLPAPFLTSTCRHALMGDPRLERTYGAMTCTCRQA